MSDYRIAPAVRAALDQATALWPTRSELSDGTIGDPAHRNRRSWHNPCDRWGNTVAGGTVCAFDLTHDPAAGCDAHALVRALVASRDARVNEVISKGQIWTREFPRWRPYGGENPHTRHAHVSVTWEHRNDTSPWWRTSTTSTADDREFIMASKAELEEVVEAVVRKHAATIIGKDSATGGDADPTHLSLRDSYRLLQDVNARLVRIEKALGEGR